MWYFLDEEDAAWYPRQKVQSARKKLEGFNPAYVMRLVQIITILLSLLNLINLTKFNYALYRLAILGKRIQLWSEPKILSEIMKSNLLGVLAVIASVTSLDFSLNFWRVTENFGFLCFYAWTRGLELTLYNCCQLNLVYTENFRNVPWRNCCHYMNRTNLPWIILGMIYNWVTRSTLGIKKWSLYVLETELLT